MLISLFIELPAQLSYLSVAGISDLIYFVGSLELEIS